MQSTASDKPSVGIALCVTQVATTVRNNLQTCKVVNAVWGMKGRACMGIQICTMRIGPAQQLVILNFYPWSITTHQ